MSLQDKLDAVKAEFELIAPARIRAMVDAAINDLLASVQAQRAMKAGDHAPVFVPPDPEGKPVSSAELLRDGPLVVTFYRGGWCPYCNLDLQEIEGASSEIRARGASVVAISAQTFNGEDSWTLPMPARYVIGQDGLIAYAEVDPDHTLRPDPGELRRRSSD